MTAIINDLRAMHMPSMETQAPAKVACNECNFVGVRLVDLNTTVYLAAVSYLKSKRDRESKRLRREWLARNQFVPDSKRLFESDPPSRRTREYRVLAGKATEDAKLVSQAAADRARQLGGYFGLGPANAFVQY